MKRECREESAEPKKSHMGFGWTGAAVKDICESGREMMRGNLSENKVWKYRI
ncbi:hypothetical protein NSB25_00445 [Acetatifactor muris]|uniref:hypothetical protein n=1 Tax=Acetatifactor muris TaxID=879566 RepID=UPI001559B48C|nr:hypothetical protein [Acetatifactor muris]MCI8799526.1 hypothetical protein [Lachnospiraceae bacterium]MCR2045756.1 hypothetical protein [Acetatifactor muris]